VVSTLSFLHCWLGNGNNIWFIRTCATYPQTFPSGTSGGTNRGGPALGITWKWPLNWRTGVGGCDPTLGKSWDEIIPEGERQKIDEDELHQQLVALNPPPRSRKTINKSAVSAAAASAAAFYVTFETRCSIFFNSCGPG